MHILVIFGRLRTETTAAVQKSLENLWEDLGEALAESPTAVRKLSELKRRPILW